MSVRKIGAKLVFVHILQDGVQLQCIFNESRMKHNMDQTPFAAMAKRFHRGDIIGTGSDSWYVLY